MASRTAKQLFSLAALLLAGATVSGSVNAQGAIPAGAFYCCTDASGRRACGDLLPAQCTGLAHKIYNRQGMLIREVGPPLTPEEKAAQAEAARREKQLEAMAREQRRKDQALLETYSSLEDVDRMQARAETDVRNAITMAEAKIAEARKRRKKFENEAEFYPNRALPHDVAKGLRDEDMEIKAQTELIDAKKREMELIKAKYAEDRRRYIELSRRPLR